MSVIVTENKFCYSLYYPESKVLHSTYSGMPKQELILEHYSDTMKLIENHEIAATLIDLRKIYGSYFKYIELLAGDAYPKMKKKGLHSLAYVISNDLLVENVTYKLVEAVKQLSLKAKVFTNFNEAKKWILSRTEQDQF